MIVISISRYHTLKHVKAWALWQEIWLICCVMRDRSLSPSKTESAVCIISQSLTSLLSDGLQHSESLSRKQVEKHVVCPVFLSPLTRGFLAKKEKNSYLS